MSHGKVFVQGVVGGAVGQKTPRYYSQGCLLGRVWVYRLQGGSRKNALNFTARVLNKVACELDWLELRPHDLHHYMYMVLRTFASQNTQRRITLKD